MRVADFASELTANGQIAVPPEIAAQVPPGETIKVVLQWGFSEGDADWRAARRSRFEAAYAEDDSIYQALIHDSETR